MAASIGNIKLGQSGSAVSEIQKLLNQNGYSLATDGIFGSQTQQAVRDYQQKYGLQVDGIVGTQTLSSLWQNTGSTNSTQAPTNNNPTVNFLTNYGNRPSYSPNYGSAPTYSPSGAVNDAAARLAQIEGSRPGAYQSNYATQIQGILDKIMNREKFSYDFASDPMYQQYAQQYQQKGKMAMLDTMGNAAALSGGYGNSYAQTAGQQAYQGYLQNLNDVIPQLRDAAYGMYRDEGQEMYNQMGLLQGLDNTDYGRHRDTVGDWYSDRGYAADRYDAAYARDYGAHRDNVSDWQDNRNFGYGVYRDQVSDFESDRAFNYGASQDQLAQQNWAQQFAYQQSQDSLAQQNWEKEYGLAAQKARSGGSSGGSSSKSSSKAVDPYKMIDGKTVDQLENVVINIWNSGGGMRDPRQAIAGTNYTAKQKNAMYEMLEELNAYTSGRR